MLRKNVPEGMYIPTYQRSYRLSHAMPHMIFGDVEEREQGERKRWLPRETTVLEAKI